MLELRRAAERGVAIRELVLFTVSPQYLQLRKELSLALPEQALAPIIDLG